MFKKISKKKERPHPKEAACLLPCVADLYHKKKDTWTREDLSPQQQMKTAQFIEGVLWSIRYALMKGRYKTRYYNELGEVLDKYARRFFHAPADRIRVFGAVEHLLNQGDEGLQKIAWWYQAYPEVYEAKLALNKSGLKLDKIKRFFNKDSLPRYSFISFAKGENPAFSYYPQLWDKILVAQNFKCPKENNPYDKWLLQSKEGQTYAYGKMVYKNVLRDLLLQAHDYLNVEEKVKKVKSSGR